MKLKKVLAILLTTAMVMSMSVGNVVLAADVNPQTEVQQVENTAGSTSEREQTKKEDQKTETGENEKGDQKTSEKETAEETQKESAAENREQKKQDAQEETVQEPKSEEIETRASGTIYLNPLSGSDSKTGTTSANAVKTLDKAKQLVTAGGTIYITGSSLNIASDTTISGNITIKRDSSLSASKSMIMVENGATLTLENVTLDGASNGQLVYAQHANLVINAGTKLCNSQTAAIRITDGTLTMNGGEIYNNRGKYESDCGAVEVGRLLGAATFVMNGGKIYNNTSGGESAPGAIHVDKDCSFTMKGGEIYGNSTNGMGGAIDSAGTVTIEAGNIYSNSAANGGAIHTFDAGKTIIAGGTIRANSATNGGGAFNVNENATLEISDGTITANTAAWGGAINAYNHATIKLYGTGSITKNVSEKNAGALCLEGGVNPTDGKGSSFVMTGGSITENVAGNGGDFGAGGAIVGYVWQGPVDIQILGGTISGNTAMDEGAGIVLRGDAGAGVATLKLGGSPKITDEVFLGDLTNFPDTKAEVISAFTPVNPVPITDSGWLDNRVVVSYAKGLAANVNDFTPADGNDNSAIIQDGLNLKSINKVLVSFVEKGYIADGNHTKYKSVLQLPNEKISKAEIPTVDNKPGYKVIGWKNSDTDTDWNFDQDVVTGSLHLYPVFQLEPAAFELKADKDHLHGEDGDKITLTTEFTAHGANNISYEWQWYKDGTLVKDGKNVDSLEVTEPGTYKVIVIADDGNLHSDSVEKTITITKTDHEYGTSWESDATQHWKTCKECQNKADAGAHIFGDWTVETQQTRAAEEVKVRSCQVCGYEERINVQPQTFDVVFKEADGSKEYGTIQVKENEKIAEAKIPAVTKDGYTLTGWKSADGEWDFVNDAVTGRTELYPVWKLNAPKIDLSPNKDHLHEDETQGLTLTAGITDLKDTLTYTYKWYREGNVIDGAKDAILRITEPGAYKVEVTANDGNISSDVASKELTITKTNHEYGTSWESDATQHWKTCKECQKKADVAAHIFGDWSVETQQTRAAGTVKVRSCQVCGYEERVTVPAEPGEEKNISVSYEFASKTKDAQLPAEVLALLPKDTNSYAKGEAVKAIQPEKTTVKVTNGTWKFEGYDADEKEAVTGLIFTGSWSFTKDRTTDEDKNPTNPGNPDQDKPGTDNQGNGNQNKGQTQNGTSGNNTAVKGNTASRTGDFSQIEVNMVLTLLSGLLLAGFAGRTRRRKNR